jgi:hypothetical protein
LTLGLPKNLMSIVVENAILVSFDVQHLTIWPGGGVEYLH